VREWVIEQILYGTSATLYAIVPFTLVHAEKHRTEDEFKNTENTQTKYNPQKANKHKTQQNKTSLV